MLRALKPPLKQYSVQYAEVNLKHIKPKADNIEIFYVKDKDLHGDTLYYNGIITHSSKYVFSNIEFSSLWKDILKCSLKM